MSPAHLPRSPLTRPAALVACLAILLGAPGDGYAEAPEAGADRGTVVPVRRAPRSGLSEPVPYAIPLRLEHRGMFRFRPELVTGGDVGTPQSGVPRPIAALSGSDPDAASLGWASLRLRYRPILHIGSNMAVLIGIDAPDNLVLGSTHAQGGRLLMPPLTVGIGTGLGDAQAPPSAGRYGWRDGIRIREAAFRIRLFDLIDFEAGRGIDHFGLGLFRNDGHGLDADFGSVIDRMAIGVSIAGFRIEAAFEFTASGVTSDQAFPHERGADGQPRTLGMADDVVTWMLRAGSFPRSDAEHEARRVKLDEERAWVVDWALNTTITSQDKSSSEPLLDTSIECAPSRILANGDFVQPYDCIRLHRRDAFFLRPGLWLKAESRPDPTRSVRIELEAQGMFGSVGHVQRFLDDEVDDSRSFLGFGAAAEIEVWDDALGFGLDTGLATGHNGQFIGYLDGQNVLEVDDDAFLANEQLRRNRQIGSFFFNRDYRLDLILFRQVLGGVTNAVYAKPWVAYRLLNSESVDLRLRLDALYAAAMRPSGTPGGGGSWGVEVDGGLELRFASGLEILLTAGALIPLDALQDPLSGRLPDPAFALRSIVALRF